MSIKVIVLDFDGVVVESVQIKEQAFRDIFKDYPKEHEEMQAFRRANPTKDRFEIFQHTAKEIFKSISPETLKEKWVKEYQEYTRREISACPFVAGSVELLKAYSPKLPIYISSLTPETELRWIIEKRGLTSYFKNLFGKPGDKPAAIRKIMASENVTKEEVLFVGDSIEDLKAAQAVGVRFVGRRGADNFKDIPLPVYDDLFGVSQFIKENL